MNLLSLPIIMMAGISFYVGAYHLLIYLRRLEQRADLTFALLSFANGLYDIFCFGLYNAQTVAEGADWQKAQFIALALFSTAFLWFMADYTGLKPGIVTYVLSALFLASIVVQAVDRSGLTFMIDQPAVKAVILPAGLRITYFEATLGPLTVAQSLLGLVFSFFILWRAALFFRHGDRKKATPLLAALLLMIVAAVNDNLMSNGLYHFIYLIEYSFLAMIVVMAFSLSRAVVEASLTKRELELARVVVENSPVVLFRWVAAEHWPVDFVSENVRQFGYSAAELTRGDVNFSSLVHPADLERVAREVADHTAAGNAVFTQEYRLLTKDGDVRWVEDRTMVERRADGAATHYQGIIVDITERKCADDEIRRLNAELEHRVRERTRELENTLKELESFSYSISHDLRAPLRTMSAFSRILRDDYTPLLPPDAARRLATIDESSRQLGRLVDGLLRFSRLSRQPLNLAPVSMTTLAVEALHDLEPEREGRDIEIVAGALPDCRGDPLLLRQVWANLFSNAIKFTRHAPRARIGYGFGEEGGEAAYFVKDNGAGFDMAYADKLFGVFQRLHSNDEFEGTGIGLATIQRIIVRHGGRIWAAAEPDKGATFYFTIG